MVEFFDYNCHFCKGALPDITRLMKDDPNLKVVLKDFPVLGPDSVEASRVAIAVRNQLTGDKFWQFHQKLLGMHGVVGKDQAMAWYRAEPFRNLAAEQLRRSSTASGAAPTARGASSADR